MLERDQKILVQLLLLAAGLVLQPFALRNRVVLLGVGRCDFLAVEANHFNNALKPACSKC